MTRPGDPVDDGRETFKNLVQSMAEHPINEAKRAIADQLLPVGERLKEMHGAVRDLGEDIEKHHQGEVSFQESAREELAALRSGQDELRRAVQGIGEELASAQGRLITAVRCLAALYVLLTVALGLVVVLLVTS